MTTSKKNLIKRRISFSQMARELGLPPTPTALETWKPELLSDDADDVLKAAKKDAGISGDLKWLVAPMVIATQERELSATSTIIDFLESAQITETLVADLENDGSIKKPEDSAKFITIVSKATVGKPVGSQKLFSEIMEGFDQRKTANRSLGLNLKNKDARLALSKNYLGCDALSKNEPNKQGMSPGNWSNCAVSTMFIHCATSHDMLGGTDATMFLNYVPPALLSRCMPYLEITLDLPDGADKRKLIQALGPSLLLSDRIGNKDNPGLDTAFTYSEEGDPNNPDVPRRSIGNDAFNLPQTLSMSKSRIARRLNDIDPVPTDQFAPHAVIESFSYKLSAGGSVSQLNTREAARGELTIRFPDKTQLTGLDQLILGTNGLLTMTVEFGWSSLPVKSSDFQNSHEDVILDYVNRQNIRIGCTTTLNSIEFSESGSAKVSLGLMDPGSQSDQISGGGKGIVADYMTIHNKTNSRFINFIVNYLSNGAAESIDDIATKDSYTYQIKKILNPAKKTKKQQKKNQQFIDSAKTLHFSVDDLAKIKEKKLLKGSDKIVEQLNLIAGTNLLAEDSYTYYFVDFAAGGWYADKCKEALESVKKLSAKKATKRYFGKKMRLQMDILEKSLSEKVVYFIPPADKQLEPHQIFHKHSQALAALKKQRNLAIKRLKADDYPFFDFESDAKETMSKKAGYDQFHEFLSDARDSGSKSKRILPLIAADKPIVLPTNFEKDPPEPSDPPCISVGLIKLPYPDSITKAKTKSQKASLVKKKKDAKATIKSVTNTMLCDGRGDHIIWSYHHLLSNGYILRTKEKAGKDGKRITDKDGKDAHTKVVDPKKNNIMKWWHGVKDASKFVPFSHVVHFSLVQTLYALGQYDEIQVLYFKYNSSCGRLSNASIGDTPISQVQVKAAWKAAGDDPYAFINRLVGGQLNTWNSSVPFGFKSDPKADDTKPKVKKPRQVVPSVHRLTRVLRCETIEGEGKNSKKVMRKILRLVFVDTNSTQDEGAGIRVMNSLRDDGRTTSISNDKPTGQKATNEVRKKALIDILEKSGVISEVHPSTGEATIKLGPRTFNIIKATFKAIHPHLNYGTMASGILGASMSGKMTGTEEMMAHSKGIATVQNNPNSDRHNSAAAGKAPELPLAEITGMKKVINVQMVGCPLLQVGSIYFVDFYTGTDLDNFYIVETVEHKINGSKFETSVKLIGWDSEGRVTIPGEADGLNRLLGENKDP